VAYKSSDRRELREISRSSSTLAESKATLKLCVYMCVCVYVSIHTCMLHPRTHTHTYTCIHVSYVYTYIHIYRLKSNTHIIHVNIQTHRDLSSHQHALLFFIHLFGREYTPDRVMTTPIPKLKGDSQRVTHRVHASTPTCIPTRGQPHEIYTYIHTHSLSFSFSLSHTHIHIHTHIHTLDE